MTVAAVLATLLVAGLAAAAAALRRGRPGGAAPPPVSVESRIALSREAGVALVRAGGSTFLVGWGRDGVRLLARLDPSEDR
ncbi:MAG TPA: flagellar biosynthetic protein FliO [Anaeromyxobacteraceae bacterium]|nr:flagellar biosynthetic protein FliO [Anaeromyxobacteraceae bacterium]